jgi:hypothetical protein
MPHDTLDRLDALDPALLTGVVRRDQGSSALEIGHWHVERLSAKGIISNSTAN